MPKEELNEILFDALQSIYKFERMKVISFELTFESIYLLQFLKRNSPVKIGDIAREMRMVQSTVSRAVARLEKKGFVKKRSDKNDKRNIYVSIKASGKKIVSEVENHTYELISSNIGSLSESKIDSFIETALSLKQIFKEKS